MISRHNRYLSLPSQLLRTSTPGYAGFRVAIASGSLAPAYACAGAPRDQEGVVALEKGVIALEKGVFAQETGAFVFWALTRVRLAGQGGREVG